MKICKTCNIEKPLDKFHAEPRGKFGRKAKCGQCCTNASNAWKIKNIDREKENRRLWNAANSKRHKESTDRWRKANTQEYNMYMARWQRKRRSEDPKFKMLTNIRSLVSNHFSNRNICKTNNLEELLKLSWPEFYSRTIALLEPGMTKENYGKYWSFDHICPCSIAKNVEEMILLQHWSNWRPMVHLGKDGNLSKQDKMTDDAVRLCHSLLNRAP